MYHLERNSGATAKKKNKVSGLTIKANKFLINVFWCQGSAAPQTVQWIPT